MHRCVSRRRVGLPPYLHLAEDRCDRLRILPGRPTMPVPLSVGSGHLDLQPRIPDAPPVQVCLQHQETNLPPALLHLPLHLMLRQPKGRLRHRPPFHRRERLPRPRKGQVRHLPRRSLIQTPHGHRFHRSRLLSWGLSAHTADNSPGWRRCLSSPLRYSSPLNTFRHGGK